MDDLGVPLFQETSRSIIKCLEHSHVCPNRIFIIQLSKHGIKYHQVSLNMMNMNEYERICLNIRYSIIQHLGSNVAERRKTGQFWT